MRELTPSEILSLGTLLQMETNAIAVAKASVDAMTDEQLKTMTEAGITAGQNRIAGLQQFIMDNQIVPIKEVQ